MLIDVLGSDHGHVSGTAGGDAMEENTLPRASGHDDLGVFHAKVSARGLLTEGAHFISRHFRIHHERHRAASMLTVTMGAVRVQPGTGADLGCEGFIVWIGQSSLTPAGVVGIDEAEVGEHAGAGFGELLRLEGQGETAPRIVTAHALTATVKAVGVLVFATRKMLADEIELSLVAIRSHEIGVGACIIPTVGIGSPGLAIEMENLGLDVSRALGLSGLEFHADGLGEHCVFGPSDAGFDAGRVFLRGDLSAEAI